jgi:hypothetical protein
MSDKTTKGEATVDRKKIGNRDYIAVGILGTNKIIALCGYADAPDAEESEANAIRIASSWNSSNLALFKSDDT